MPRRAEPSEFRSILPGSARRDAYKTNLTLSSTNSNHTPKASRLGRPGATYQNQFQSRRAAPYSHAHKRTVIISIMSIAYEIKMKIFLSQYCAHSSLWFGTAQHGKSFVLIKQKSRSKSNISRTQISMVRRGAARLIKRA